MPPPREPFTLLLLLLWTRYRKKTLRHFLQTYHKCPLWLNNELIRFWRSQVKDQSQCVKLYHQRRFLIHITLSWVCPYSPRNRPLITCHRPCKGRSAGSCWWTRTLSGCTNSWPTSSWSGSTYASEMASTSPASSTSPTSRNPTWSR